MKLYSNWPKYYFWICFRTIWRTYTRLW